MTKILHLIYTVKHLATPFLVFFSFLDSIISGHVTQITDLLPYRKIKVTDFSEVAKFWKGLINFVKVMIIIRFMQIITSGLALTCLRKPYINTRGVGRIRDSYANPRRSREFSQRLECLYQAMQTQEKSFLLLL